MDNIPTESLLEETYYHRIDPPQGFVFQRVYSDSRDIDEAMAVEDRDVVLVPRGYHPVVVPYRYQSYYFNVMAGRKRVWHFATTRLTSGFCRSLDQRTKNTKQYSVIIN